MAEPLVFITGASSGIGQALAWRYHQAGFRLALVARRGAEMADWARAQGIPDDRWGEEVGAFVRLREGSTATAAELTSYVRDRMAHYKVPKRWVFVDAFPLTGSGKVQKFVLREQFVKGELTPAPDEAQRR